MLEYNIIWVGLQLQKTVKTAKFRTSTEFSLIVVFMT